MSVFTKPMTVTHYTDAGLDADGRPVQSETTATVTAGYRHREAVDRFDAGLVVVDEWIAYMPPDTAVAVGDKVLIAEGELEVVSQPFPVWNHRRGLVHHLEVRLRRVQRAPRPVSTMPAVAS